MRIQALAAALLFAVSLSACSKSSNDQSSSSSTAAPDAAATAASNTGGMAATAGSAAPIAGSIAIYPGAALQAGGQSSSGGMGTTAGKVYVTADSYDKVTAWYKSHMPSDAQSTNTSAGGTNSTVYALGVGTDHQQSLAITSSPATQGKVWITIAEVKK
jgi:hypothetical protein